MKGRADDNAFNTGYSEEVLEYHKRWTYNGKLGRMIYIPELPSYYRNEPLEEPTPFKEKAWAYFVRATLFIAMPFALLFLLPFMIYAGSHAVLEAKTFRGFWNDN